MKNKRLISIVIVVVMACLTILSSLALTGCSSKKDKGPQKLVFDQNDEKAYLNGLEDGKFYVRHKNEFSEVYFNNTTFEKGKMVTRANEKRIYWFKEDEDKIPTLYKGDSLVLFTRKSLEEKFILERFMDLGYSVGLCMMTPTESGRYAISTDIKKKNTYPYSDADAITKLSNKQVIVDSINKPIRYYKEEYDKDTNELISPPESIIVPTKYGTIPNLKQNEYYDVKVYEGTVEHDYKLQANVFILGSMEVLTDLNYKFDDEYLLGISLPADLKTGYYSINGQGLFRYVAESTYNKNTNFNEPNETDKEKEESYESQRYADENVELDLTRENDVKGTKEERQEVLEKANKTLESVAKDAEDLVYPQTKQFNVNVTGDGYFRIKVLLTGSEDAKSHVTGTVSTPAGETTKLSRSNNGDLSAVLSADIDGRYIVMLYDISDEIQAKVVTEKVPDPTAPKPDNDDESTEDE